MKNYILKVFPKIIYLHHVCMYSKLFTPQKNSSADSYPGLKTLNWQELFIQGFFNGRCPRPGNFTEIKSWAVEQFQCFTSQKTIIAVLGIPLTFPRGQMHRDTSWRAARQERASGAAADQGGLDLS